MSRRQTKGDSRVQGQYRGCTGPKVHFGYLDLRAKTDLYGLSLGHLEGLGHGKYT